MNYKLMRYSKTNDLLTIHKTLGIFRHDLNKNRWKLFIRFPSEYDGEAKEFIIDNKNGKIYIIFGYYLLIFDEYKIQIYTA